MGNKIRIGVVEDEIIIADSIGIMLRKLGYEPCIAYNHDMAVNMLKTVKPGLLLLDINLGLGSDGISVAKYAREYHTVPIVFLTAYSDANTLNRSKPLRPDGFLVKPFTKEGLYSAIEIALSNHTNIASTSKQEEAILVKDGYHFEKVYLKDILYLSSEQNYITFHLSDSKKVMMRSTMQKMKERLPSSFVRLNRSCIINSKHVSRIETDRVFIKGKAFSFTKHIHDELVELLQGI